MKIKLILAVLIFILFTGCSHWVSVNPLSPPTELDKKLEGTWKFDSNDNEEVYLHIGKKTNNTMTVLSVEHKKDGSLEITEIPFYITKTGVNSYFNIRYEDLEKDAGEKGRGYIFVKYSFPDENRLFIYQFDSKIIESAVQSGRLKGEIHYKAAEDIPSPENTENEISVPIKTIDYVVITDTSENMIKFINTEGNRYEDDVLKFIRVK